MNSPKEFPSAKGPVPSTPAVGEADVVDTTLRLVAKLPPPAGLEDRVFTSVLRASRKGRVLQWPGSLHVHDWMRSAAAAAIALAVGGGGWGIYLHVQHNEPARATAAPRVIMQSGGFSSAGAIRRPQTLNGPVVKQQVESSKPEDSSSLKSTKTKESSPRSEKSGTRLKHPGDKTKPHAERSTTAEK